MNILLVVSQIVLITLAIVGSIAWSWLVFLPLIIWAVVVSIVLLALFVAGVSARAFSRF